MKHAEFIIMETQYEKHNTARPIRNCIADFS